MSFPEHSIYMGQLIWNIKQRSKPLACHPPYAAPSRSLRTSCFLVTWIFTEKGEKVPLPCSLFLYELVSLLLHASFASSPREGFLMSNGNTSPLKLCQASQRKQDRSKPVIRMRFNNLKFPPKHQVFLRILDSGSSANAKGCTLRAQVVLVKFYGNSFSMEGTAM